MDLAWKLATQPVMMGAKVFAYLALVKMVHRDGRQRRPLPITENIYESLCLYTIINILTRSRSVQKKTASVALVKYRRVSEKETMSITKMINSSAQQLLKIVEYAIS